MTIRVLIADDHALFRDGLVSLLEDAGFLVIGQAGDGQSAIEQTMDLHPDLVLLDLHMPRMNGLEALRQIKGRIPEMPVVMLTISDDEDCLVEAIKEGAEGYLLKQVDFKTFLEALSGLQRGEAALMGKSVKVLMSRLARLSTQDTQQKPRVVLSDREIEILRLIAKGHSNAAISDEISLSENTIKYHIKNILQKLNAHNRMEAVLAAMREGILQNE